MPTRSWFTSARYKVPNERTRSIRFPIGPRPWKSYTSPRFLASALNFPARVDYFGDPAALRDLKASDFIVGLLSQTSHPLPKRDLYMLAALSRPEEIHPDVVAMLDAVAEILPPRVPSIEANVTPPNANGVDADVEVSQDGTPDQCRFQLATSVLHGERAIRFRRHGVGGGGSQMLEAALATTPTRTAFRSKPSSVFAGMLSPARISHSSNHTRSPSPRSRSANGRTTALCCERWLRNTS